MGVAATLPELSEWTLPITSTLRVPPGVISWHAFVSHLRMFLKIESF